MMLTGIILITYNNMPIYLLKIGIIYYHNTDASADYSDLNPDPLTAVFSSRLESARFSPSEAKRH